MCVCAVVSRRDVCVGVCACVCVCACRVYAAGRGSFLPSTKQKAKAWTAMTGMYQACNVFRQRFRLYLLQGIHPTHAVLTWAAPPQAAEGSSTTPCAPLRGCQR